MASEAARQTIPAGSTATGTSSTVLDNGDATSRSHTAVASGSAGISAGAFVLMVSNDGTNWVQSQPVTLVASTKVAVSLDGNYRYAKAVISTTVTGGTVGITVQSY